MCLRCAVWCCTAKIDGCQFSGICFYISDLWFYPQGALTLLKHCVIGNGGLPPSLTFVQKGQEARCAPARDGAGSREGSALTSDRRLAWFHTDRTCMNRVSTSW